MRLINNTTSTASAIAKEERRKFVGGTLSKGFTVGSSFALHITQVTAAGPSLTTVFIKLDSQGNALDPELDRDYVVGMEYTFLGYVGDSGALNCTQCWEGLVVLPDVFRQYDQNYQPRRVEKVSI